MIGVEFGAPTSFKLKASWAMLETASKGLFCQLITIPLFKEHKILTQVAGHASHTIKLIPTLVINEDDCDWIVRAFDDVIADAHSAGRGVDARQEPGRARAEGVSWSGADFDPAFPIAISLRRSSYWRASHNPPPAGDPCSERQPASADHRHLDPLRLSPAHAGAGRDPGARARRDRAADAVASRAGIPRDPR